MVQLAPDASPLSHRLQPKKMHKLFPLASPGHLYTRAAVHISPPYTDENKYPTCFLVEHII